MGRNSLKIALSLTACETFIIFNFPLKLKNFLKIALSVIVSEIFTIFYFPLKFEMAVESGAN